MLGTVGLGDIEVWGNGPIKQQNGFTERQQDGTIH